MNANWIFLIFIIIIVCIYYASYYPKKKYKVALSNIGNSRLGNRLFIYWTAKLISYLYGHEFVGENTSILKDPIYIDDSNYNDILKRRKLEIKKNDIIVKGWFQDLDIFGNYYRDVIKSMMNKKNSDSIYYNNMLAKDFAKQNSPKLKINPNKKDLVIHIRLDDYIHDGYNSNIINVNYYKNAIGDCKKWDRIIIVTDILRRDFEYKYIEELLKSIKCEVIIHSGNVLEDWHLLRSAINFVVSNSTFAWTALLCGNAKWGYNTRYAFL